MNVLNCENPQSVPSEFSLAGYYMNGMVRYFFQDITDPLMQKAFHKDSVNRR